MSKENVISLWIVIALFAIGAYLYVNRPAEVTVNNTPKTNDAAIKNEYMKACNEGGQYAYCDCTYEHIKSAVGVDGIITLGLEYTRTGIYTKEMTDAVDACLYLAN
jgi:hypothetical protein